MEKSGDKNYSNRSYRFMIVGTVIMIVAAVVTGILFRVISKTMESIQPEETVVYDKHYAFIAEDSESDLWAQVLAASSDQAREYGAYLEDLGTVLGRDYSKLLYSYQLESPTTLETPNFSLDFSMGAEDRGITADDYPLTIRTVLPTDRFVVHGFNEPVVSLFSTWKMPVRLRYVWPIFVNKNGKVVYVPRYRRYFREYHTSKLQMFVRDEEK